MAITQQTFMGATVQSYRTSIGLNNQPSQLSVRLVQDFRNGDSFFPQVVGTPAFFQHGNFVFNGLFQRYQQLDAIDGKPTYEVTIVDPRELLDGVQIITSSYSGAVGTVKNLVNAFGWWENQSFGLSLANDSGMPWLRILYVLNVLCNSPNYTNFGGPITFQGTTYGIDLSELPTPPIYYRMSGPSITLLEAITQICEDGGCDFFVELEAFTIRVRTISRLSQPPLGTISSLANSYSGICASSSSGLELRNEITSSFLVGGEQTRLHLSSNIYQFFGYDYSGFPIVGFEGQVQFYNTGGSQIGSQSVLNVNLNAAEVADIYGQLFYSTNTLELRLAKGDYASWAAYMYHYRRNIADMVGITTIFANLAAVNSALNKPDVTNDDPLNANRLSDMSSEANAKSMRFYEFVRKQADEYYGRKYLVAIPFVLRYQDGETLKVISSYDINGEGAYLPEGSQPLGLSPLNEDIFKNPDGRFRTFVEYTNLSSADLSSINPQGSILEGNSLFVEVQVDPSIVYYNGLPFALITTSAPLSEKAVDSYGDILQILRAALQLTEGPDAQRLLENCFITGLVLAPEVIVPTYAAVPLRSNILTYGPWYFAGVPGKVKFDYDPGLTPWNYGGYGPMNLAGESRVATAATNMLISESGHLEFAGAPIASLGDVMQNGGPNITNLDVEISTSRIMTTYRFQTFTQKFGVFSKGNIERMKRFSLTNLSLRRAIRTALRINLAKQAVLGPAMKKFMENAPPLMRKNTPHDTIVSHSFYDTAEQATRMTCHTVTTEEAVALSNSHNSTAFRETAVMSLNGLFRPFSTKAGVSNYMPAYLEDADIDESTVPCLNSLNPFARPNDVEMFAWGSSYSGLNAFRRGGDTENARALALRGPLLIAGFGFGINTKLVPGNERVVNLKRQERWKVGPLDPLWDDKRGVWTCHGTLKGITGSKFPADGSGLFKVKSIVGADWEMTAWNWFSTGVSGDTKVICSYVPNDNRWYIMAADCPSG